MTISPTLFLFANNAQTTLAADLGIGATTATLTNGSAFPSPGAHQQFSLTLFAADPTSNEIVYVTARSGNTVTIVRAREGSSAAAWSAGAFAANFPTAAQGTAWAQPATLQAQAGNYALDSGSVNAYVVALDPAVQTYTNGLPIRWMTAHSNTAASTLNAGAGAKPLVRQDGSPLQNGDITANTVMSAVYVTSADKFYLGGLVASLIAPAGGLVFVNANRSADPGFYYVVDTASGGVVMTLPSGPALGASMTFMDATNSWAAFNLVLGHNGNTIMGSNADLACNVPNQEFTIWWNGSDWRLL